MKVETVVLNYISLAIEIHGLPRIKRFVVNIKPTEITHNV